MTELAVRAWTETRERWIARAARAADISHSAARSLFYGTGHQPRAITVEKVRRAVAARTKKEAILVENYADLVERLERLEEAFRQSAP